MFIKHFVYSFFQKKFKKSLSILELTISLAIAGALTGISAYYGSKIYNNSKNNADDLKIKVIKKALQDYFTYNNRLPKPADYLLPRNDNSFGREKNTNTGDISFDADVYSVKEVPVYKIKNKDSRIPETYRQVEYIEGDRTQTGTFFGINWTTSTKIQFKYMYTRPYGHVFIGFHNNDEEDCRFFIGETDRNTFFDCSVNTYRIRVPYVSLNQIYETEIGNYYIKDIPTDTIIGSSTINYSIPASSSKTIGIFTMANKDSGRIYYIKIYEGTNSVLQRELYPVYRLSDGKPGLYDVVGNVFYTNTGGNNFTYGNELTRRVIDSFEQHEIKENMTYTMYRGIVPFKDLKLTENDVVDMYGNYFEYYVPEIMTIEQGKTPSVYDVSNEFVKVGYRKKDNSWGNYSKYPCPSIRNRTPNALCNANKNNLYGILFNKDPQQLTRLPNGFQEVEYIESTAGQRVVTTYTPNYSDEILIDMSLTNLSKTSTLWCSRAGLTNNTITSFFIMGSGIRVDYQTTQTQTFINPNINERFVFRYKDGDYYYNDRNVFSGAKRTSLSGGSITLFASYNGAADINYSYEKLYRFYVKNNGIMKLDLVPCYTTKNIQANQVSNGIAQLTGTVGLFDVVSQKFFPNNASGSFIAGPETKLANQYLQPPYGLRVKDLKSGTDLSDNGSIAYVLVGKGRDGGETCSLHKRQDNSERPQEITFLLTNITKNYQKYSAQNCLNANENSTYNVIGRNQFGTIEKEWTFYKGGKTDFFDDKVEYETLERLVDNSKL